MIYIKVHASYRKVVAVCDLELVGKKFEEGARQIDVRENFYKGEEFEEDEAVKQLQKHKLDDATFNIVGKRAVRAAIIAGLINEESFAEVAGVPYSLVLL